MLSVVDFLTDPGFILAVIAFTALLLTSLGVVLWIRKWRKSYSAGEFNPDEALNQFHELYQEGELDADEFERICQMLDKNGHAEAEQENGSR